MAGELANGGEHLALDLLFRNAATPPSGIYLGLTTAAISDTDDLTTITEVDDGNYARQSVTFTAPSQVSEKGTIYNDSDVQFGPWDTNEDGDISHAFLTDAGSGTTGTLIAWFALAETKSPLSGETLTINADDLIFDID